MPSIALCFKLHIPYRLQHHLPGQVGMLSGYFDNETGRATVNRLVNECYMPANKILLAAIKATGQRFKVAFSISGTALELLQAYRPDVIRSFQQLVRTGCVEIMAETYYNSLAWLYSKNEFCRQVQQHRQLVKELFGIETAVFRNTALIYNNELAVSLIKMGFKGIICEGTNRILQGRSCNQVYAAPGNIGISVLPRNARLSDDIAFRFDDAGWNEQPLTAEKFAGWIHGHGEDASQINIFFDYETFGIHKKSNTGIFEFLEHLPGAVLAGERWQFNTPAEAINNSNPTEIFDAPVTISWQDKSLENCVWCENMMQHNMLTKIYSLENMVHNSPDPRTLENWGRLQSADHFYYMSKEGRSEADASRCFNPFNSTGEAYNRYRNIITDFEIKLIQKELAGFRRKRTPATAQLY